MWRKILVLVVVVLTACSNGDQRVVEGMILEVRPGQVLVEHGNVEGLTGPGLSTFGVREPDVLSGLNPGDTIRAGVYIDEAGAYMVRLRKTGQGKLPAEYTAKKYRLQGLWSKFERARLYLITSPSLALWAPWSCRLRSSNRRSWKE